MKLYSQIRRTALCLAFGCGFAASPIQITYSYCDGFHANLAQAFARNGSDDDSSGGSGGSGSGSGSSGSGSGSSGSGSSGSGSSGSSGSGSSGSGSSGSGSGSGSGSSGSGQQPVTSNVTESGGNVVVNYSNGWIERVVDGQYELKDPKGRRVSKRPARLADYIRLRLGISN